MRLTRFLKWWWWKHDNIDRFLAIFLIFWVLPCVISSFFIGQQAFTLFAVGLLASMGVGAIYTLFYFIGKSWQQFNEDDPPDDIRIIRKLKGQSEVDHE